MYQVGRRSIRQLLLAALAHRSSHGVGGEQHYRTTFDLTWELLAFVRDYLGEGEKLSQVVTLTGTQVNAQASTCEQYIREFWPDLGPPLLSVIEDICDQCLGQRGFSEVSMVVKFPRAGSSYVGVDIKVKSNKTIIKVHGPLECQIQVTEILAWLTAAFRSSTPPSLSNSKAALTFDDDMSYSSPASFKLQPKPLYPIKDGSPMCWHTLFEHSVIAVQFPYAQRTQGIGVELSPFLMATLAGIQTAVEFRGGLILRGLSTALIPLGMKDREDAIQWHLATTKTRDDAIITELFGDLDETEGIDGNYKVQDVQQLWAKKAYLGWCNVATVRLGTQEARYKEVTWSDSSRVRRHIEFSGFSLSLGSPGLGFGGLTGNANFVIPKAQRTHFMDVEDQLKDRLKHSIARPVIIYDTLDQRGWMVPIVCLMLYMMHLRVRKLPKPPEASQNGQAPMPYARAETETAHEAYEILTRYMQPHSASRLGNSDEWNDTLALFYIALDTFFGKSKELSSRSSASHSSEISGFELMDAVLAENPFRYNSRQIQRNSGGWAQLGDIVGILFCKGIGDAIVPGVGANVLCRQLSSVPSGSNYLGAYVPCVVEVLSRQGKHKGSERLRERISYDLYSSCHHTADARCFHLQTYSQIADPPNDKKKCNQRVTKNEAPQSAEIISSHRGAIIFGKRITLVKPWPGTLVGLNQSFRSGLVSLVLNPRLAHEQSTIMD